MDYNLKIDFMKIIKFILLALTMLLVFSAFSQSPGNFSTLRVTTLNGNMKANGTSIVTADTLQLKSDTLRGDVELFVRDSTLLEIIEANSIGVNILNNSNNRLTTATGNANELQAEANLTFDGSTLISKTNSVVTSTNLGVYRYIAGGTFGLIAHRYGSIGSQISFAYANGNLGSETHATNGQTMGSITMRPWAGTDYAGTTSAYIQFLATENHTVDEQGTKINIGVASNGGASAQTRLTIDNDGQIQLPNTSNQLRLGTTNTTTITSPAPAASRTYTIPDALGAANFALTDAGVANRIPYWSSAGKMTNSANLTFDGSTLTLTGTQLTTVQSQISATTNQIRTGTGSNLTTLNFPASSGAVTLTFPNTTTNILGGSGVANRVAYWTGAGILDNSANLTFDGSDLTSVGGNSIINQGATATNYIELLNGERVDFRTVSVLKGNITRDGLLNSGMAIQGLNNSTNTALSVYGYASAGSDSGTEAVVKLSSSLDNSSVIATRPTLAGFNYTTKQWEVGANGTWNYQNNALTGISQATITNSGATPAQTITKSGSGNGLVINDTGSGSGLVITNSGGGVALQAGNITLDASVVASTSGDLTLTPTTNVDISSGALEMAGTQVLSSGRALSNLTEITSSGDITLTGGKRILGTNGRSIMLNKTVTLTDSTATTIATITLPSGSNLNGGYVAYVDGMLINTGTTAAAVIANKAYRGYVVWAQDATATSSEGFKTANVLESATGGDGLVQRNIGTIVISGSRSGGSNENHVIQLNVDGTGGTAASLYFIGTISIHWYNFSSFTAN